MSTIATTIITALVGLIGVVIGTLIGHYFNQQLNLRNSRKDILFKRKLEYFEKLAETIEQNIKLYKNSLSAIKSKNSEKERTEIVREMKEKRQKFVIMASPLYLNITNLSKAIVSFVEIEKEIFKEFETLPKSTKKQKKSIKIIEDKLKNLSVLGNSIVCQMKEELKT